METKKTSKGEENIKKRPREEVRSDESEKKEGKGESQEGTIKEQEYLEGWKRCQADFENYKKRQEDSRKDLLRYSTENIVMQILPVVDNFHSSTAHIPEDQKDGAWVMGIMHIQKQLENVLQENGVEEIQVKEGDSFDTKFHEAVESKECDGCREKKKFKNKINRVILKGYKIGEKVIRPVRVVVE